MVEHPLDSEAVAGWLSADAEAAAKAKVVRAARAEAATKIAAATEAEVAFNESIDEADTAHANARALDNAVKGKVDAGESPPIDDLVKREAAEEAARGVAFDVVTMSEVAADLIHRRSRVRTQPRRLLQRDSPGRHCSGRSTVGEIKLSAYS